MNYQILIAEDEALLREVLTEELARSFTVVAVATGKEALEILLRTPSLQLLLSDIRMTEMNGFQLAEKALQHNPELKVMFMTGSADEMPPTTLLRAREIRTLRKPFKLADLSELVAEMLARP